MNRSPFLSLLLAACLCVACSKNRPAAEAISTSPGGLVKPGPPTVKDESWEEPAGFCSGADWREAMLCDDSDCARQAVGTECATCVDTLARCAAERSTCKITCDECLGPERCATSDNVQLAASHLEPQQPDIPAGVDRYRRIGRHPTHDLLGASPDGDTLLARQMVGGSGISMPEVTITIRNAKDDVLWTLGDSGINCSIFLSPRGKWLVESCGGETRLREAETGFVRHSFEGRARERRNFGGDRWLLLEGETCRRVDLKTADVAELPFDCRDPTISWDGKWVADSRGSLIVRSVTDPSRAIELDTGDDGYVQQVAWEDSGALLVLDRSGVMRFSIPGGDLLDEASFDSDEYRRLAPSAGSHLVLRSEDGKGIYLKPPFDGAEAFFSPLIEPYSIKSFGYSLGYDSAIDGFRKLDDGRLVYGSSVFGIGVLSGAGNPEETGRATGPVLWTAPGPNEGELAVARPQGVQIWNTNSFESRPADLPLQFSHIGGRFYSDGSNISIGAVPGDHTVERDGRVLIRRPNLPPVTVQAPREWVHDAALDTEGVLHLAVFDRILSYSLDGAEPTVVREHPLETVKNDERNLLEQQLDNITLSADGEYALLHRDGTARVFETSDPSNVVFELDAKNCELSSEGLTIGCFELNGRGGMNVDVMTYDVLSGRELARMPMQMSGQAVKDVSSDGQLVAIAGAMPSRGRGVGIIDMGSTRLSSVPADNVTFWGDEVVATDGTYLWVWKRDQLPQRTR